MFSTEFSIFLSIALGVLAVVFFMGKGEGVINAFQSKSAPRKKKKSPEDELRYQRAFGVFCLLLMGDEILMATLAPVYPVFNIVSIIVVVLILVGVVLYLKKNFPDG